jgi:hypothetical protein
MNQKPELSDLKHLRCLQESQSIRSNTATRFIPYQLNNVFSAQQAIEGREEWKINTQIRMEIEVSVSAFFIYYM